MNDLLLCYLLFVSLILSTYHIVTLLNLTISPFASRCMTLTFLAEWGDRSQIATIALAAAQVISLLFIILFVTQYPKSQLQESLWSHNRSYHWSLLMYRWSGHWWTDTCDENLCQVR